MAKKKKTTKKTVNKKPTNETIVKLPLILVDSREKNGYKFNKTDKCNGSEVICLKQGDYTLQGLEDWVIIERKNSINELVSCLGVQRERFMREMDRMAHVRYKFLVIEDYWTSAMKPTRYSKMSVNFVLSSVFSLMLKRNIFVIFGGTRENTQKIIKWILSRSFHYWLKENDGNK